MMMYSPRSTHSLERFVGEFMHLYMKSLKKNLRRTCNYVLTPILLSIVSLPADLLQIARNVQQDPNEFSKLFFALIESWNSGIATSNNSFSSSCDSNKNGISNSVGSSKTIRETIAGRERSVITCGECGREGGREAEFQGVELGIESLASVAQALDHYYAEEPLTGANKYHCGHCDKLCDATRRVIPTSVPDVLILQLMR
jgi:ubiquitin carboxyl-terminal hydrolase 48